MSSMLHCLLRVCFKNTPEPADHETDDEGSDYDHTTTTQPYSNRMIRLFQPTDPASSGESSALFRGAAVDDRDEDECCRAPEESSSSASPTGRTATTTTTTTTSNARRTSSHSRRMSSNSNPSLRQLWRTFREKLNLDTTTSHSHSYTGVTSTSSTHHEQEEEEQQQQHRRDETIPILTLASSFDSSKDIPTICLDQVVMPGSELQARMAKAMSERLEEQNDECVICMENFDPTNPRMPTLCGCGENKTYFHLPCLYQWIEKSRKCPSCGEKLRWEEF